MHKRNPKQEGSNLFDAIPQSGPCPLDCNQCFYNRPGAFYVDPAKPHMPPVEEVGDGIVRVNCGHDSNIDRELVIKATECYKHRFFNTSIPQFDFPAPVAFTANREEEKPVWTFPPATATPANLMYVRLRVSPTNLEHVDRGVAIWAQQDVPVVLTFMAYYDREPGGCQEAGLSQEECYTWKVRHVNPYWCATERFMRYVLSREKAIGGRLVTMCGTPTSNWCRDCRNCETYFWQTIKHMGEVG